MPPRAAAAAATAKQQRRTPASKTKRWTEARQRRARAPGLFFGSCQYRQGGTPRIPVVQNDEDEDEEHHNSPAFTTTTPRGKKKSGGKKNSAATGRCQFVPVTRIGDAPPPDGCGVGKEAAVAERLDCLMGRMRAAPAALRQAFPPDRMADRVYAFHDFVSKLYADSVGLLETQLHG